MPGWSLILISFGFPLLLLWLRELRGLGWLKKINPVIACYVAGIVLANTGLVGEESAGPLDLVQTIAVALSIPLLLFSVDLSRSRSLSGRAGLSMGFAALSIMIVAALAHLFFRNRISGSAEVAGMLVGVYTGGTPNLAAISRALNVPQSTYLTVHTSDLVLSALYLLFIMTVAKKLLSRILPPYRSPHHGKQPGEGIAGPAHGTPVREIPHTAIEYEADSYAALFHRSNLKGLLSSLGMAITIAVLGGSVFLLVSGESAMALTILALTTLSLAASFLPFVRRQKMSYPAGQFLILVFCVSVGALADLKILFQAAPEIFLFVGFSLFGSLILHVILARLAGIDVDTVLITSTSAVCSPPFVGLTAAAIGNRDLVAPGITTGLLGYAAGNYLGVLLSQILNAWL